MDTVNIINIIGLSFDILGVVLLFFYEPPKNDNDSSNHVTLLESAPSEGVQNKLIRRKRLFNFGRNL